MAAKDTEETGNLSDTKCLGSDASDPEDLKSDEVNEMYCEHCERFFSNNMSAAGFCVNCVEYMCDTCLKYHKIYIPSHTLQDKSSMPQDFYFEKCDGHKNQLIKFYCNNCEKTECKLKDHSDCSDVIHLSSLVKGIEESNELSDLFESIESSAKQMNETKKYLDTKILDVSEKGTEEVSTVEKHNAEALAIFKRQQQEIIDNFDKKMEETIARLKKERVILFDQVEEKKENSEKKINLFKLETIQRIQYLTSSDITKLELLQCKNDLIKLKLNRLSSSIEREKNLAELKVQDIFKFEKSTSRHTGSEGRCRCSKNRCNFLFLSAASLPYAWVKFSETNKPFKRTTK